MSEQSGGGTDRDPHVPTPIENERPDGSLRVVEHSNLRRSRPRQMILSAEDRALYAILSDVLADVYVPDLFPAALATAATDTADALDRVASIDRGLIDPPLPGASYSLSYASNAADALREHRDRDPLEARGVFNRIRTSATHSVSFPFQDEPEAAGGMGPQMEWMNSEVAATDGGVR